MACSKPAARAVLLCTIGLLLAPGARADLPVLRSLGSGQHRGAAFPARDDLRLLMPLDGPAELHCPKTGETQAIPDPVNLSFSRRGGRDHVIALDTLTGELSAFDCAASGLRRSRQRLPELVGVAAAGLALDEKRDRLWVLEPSRARLLRIDGLARKRRKLAEIALPSELPPLEGLAFDAKRGRLRALARETRELLEFDTHGTLLSVDSLPKEIKNARAIAIAPSSDPGDAPTETSLFVASASLGGGTAAEVGLGPVLLAAAVATEVPPLILNVRTSLFTPPSPDPSGIELLAPNGPLLISDAEVDEMNIFQGVNLFEVALDGRLVGTGSTTFFSNEPTGVGKDPVSGRFYFSHDNSPRAIYEVAPGSDGRVTPGDSVRRLLTDASGIADPEGAAFGGGALFVMDGTGRELWRIAPGPNGIFELAGDDVISHFDTSGLGVSDPEGIAYNGDAGSLFIVGRPVDRVAEVSQSGVILRWLDISASGAVKPAGLAYGPGPTSTTRRLFVVDRGVDNNDDPNENDGKLYVFQLGAVSASNLPPVVNAGADRTVALGQSLFIDASATDDGLPSPPGQLSPSWSRVSGPGVATFTPPNAIDTNLSFSVAGSYVLRLSVGDGELTGQDDLNVNVTAPGGAQVLDSRIANGNDDVEQRADGSVSRGNSDLELVVDGSNVQIVGLRFPNLALPQGAAIQNAWIQFQADETASGTTSLTIQAEAADTALPFLSSTNNVSSRARTSAGAAWSPSPWTTVGRAGDAERTPNLAGVIQEVVSRPGWAPGNALAFVITGSGKRTAESFDGLAAGAPLLHVEYVTGGGGGPVNQPPSVSAGPDQSIDIAAVALLDGTVSDDGLPNPPGQLQIGWSQVSGPATASFADAAAVDTSASFPAAGSYVLRLTAADGQLSGQDDVSIGVSDGSAPLVVESRVAASNDDAEQAGSSVSLTSSDLELVTDGSVQTVGMRFAGLAIPPGAAIQSAWIQFAVDETNTGATSLSFRGEAANSAASFANTANNLSLRPATAAAVAWSPPAWPSVGAAGPDQRTPDLRSIVQEIVSRPGWASGNAIAILVTGSGKRVAEAFDGSSASAPLLHVEYR